MRSTNIRNILLFPFSILIMCFSAIVALVTLYNSQSYIDDLLKEVLIRTKSQVFSDLLHYQQTHEQFSRANKTFIQQDHFQKTSKKKAELSLLLKQQLSHADSIDGIYIDAKNIKQSNDKTVGFIKAESQLIPIEQTSLYHSREAAVSPGNPEFKSHWTAPSFVPELQQFALRYQQTIQSKISRRSHNFINETNIGEANFNETKIDETNIAREVQKPDYSTLNTVLSLSRLNHSLTRNLNDHPGYVFIADDAEQLIAHSDMPVSSSSKKRLLSLFDSALAHTKASNDTIFHYDNTHFHIASFNIDVFTPFNWQLIILLEETTAHRQAASYTRNALITIICGMLLTMLLSGYLANQIAKPILYLNNRLLTWNEHSTANEAVPHTHPRIQELEQVAESVTQLQNRVSSTMRELQKTINENHHFINEIEKLALVAENTDDMVLICDPRSQIEWANESFFNKYQMTLDDILHRSICSVMQSVQSDQNYNNSDIFSELQNCDSASQKQAHRNKSGETHWIHLNIHKIRDNYNNVRHFIVVLRDITAQKHYESELAKWKTLFYAADWGIAFLEGHDNRMSLVNPAYAKHHGYALEELINCPADISYPIQAYDDIAKYCAIAKQKGSVTFETEHIKKNGKAFPVIQNISVYYDQNDRIGGLISSIQDVSEIKSLQSQLIQSQKMEAIGTLAGGMAHDFNNILASILGNAELSNLYLDMLTNHDQFEHFPELQIRISAIIKACHRASDLTNKILAYSRMSSTDFSPLELKEVLEEAVTMIEPLLPANIAISLNIPADNLLIAGNESQLQQVFVNLLTNAIYAIETIGRKEGKITITMQQTLADDNQPQVTLTFCDNGCGIPPDTLQHIFDPFFTTKEKGKGTGLGLSVVMGIMQAHNAHISVVSDSNHSSKFTLRFPIIQQSPAYNSPNDIQNIEAKPPKLLHLILVDDEAPLLDIWQQLLTSQGYRVTTFAQPQQALTQIENAPDDVDLVITDYDMESMTGETLCEILNHKYPHIPLMMLTGYSEKMNETRASELGITHLLKKPIALNALLHAVEQAVNQTNKQ